MLTLDDFKKLSDLLRAARHQCEGLEASHPMFEIVEGLDHLELCDNPSLVDDEDDLSYDALIDTGMILEEVCQRYTDLQQEHARLKTLCAKAGA